MSFKQNTAVTGLTFGLVSATDGSAITTGTVTGYYTLDGGTQATITASPVHEGNGQWSANLTAGEMNGAIVGLLFTHASAIPVSFTIKTDTKIVSELQDLTAAQVNAEADTAIADASLATAANLAIVDANVDAILVDTGTTLPASLATIDANVDSILVDTGTDIPARFDGIEGATFSSLTDSLEAIRDRGDTAWITGGGGSAPTAAEVADAVWDELQSGHTTAGTFGEVATEIASILTDTGTSLPASLATIDANVDSILVDTGTTIPARFAGIEGATFSSLTDSLEAIRDRGDVAWTTGAGGSSPTVGEIADAVWDELQSAHVTVGSFGEVATEIASILTDTGTTIPTQISGLNDLSEAQVNAQADIAIADASLATATALATVDANVDAILTDTGTTLPSAISTIDTVVDGIQTDLSNATDGLGAIKTAVDTKASQSSVDAVDANVDNVLVDTGTSLPALINALSDITTAEILASGDIDGYSIEEAMKLILSSLVGTLSGASTTSITIDAADGSKTRLTATVDADGNRIAVTKDATG